MNLDDILSEITILTIKDNLHGLIKTQEELQDRIEALEVEGCIDGHIVEEYRGERGPYYRLTFYTDKYGHKPRPKYLGNKPRVVARAKRQIANHYEREQLLEQVSRINEALRTARYRVEMLNQYLATQASQCEQLVMNLAMASA